MIKVRIVKSYTGAPIVEIMTDDGFVRLHVSEARDLLRKLGEVLGTLLGKVG